MFAALAVALAVVGFWLRPTRDAPAPAPTAAPTTTTLPAGGDAPPLGSAPAGGTAVPPDTGAAGTPAAPAGVPALAPVTPVRVHLGTRLPARARRRVRTALEEHVRREGLEDRVSAEDRRALAVALDRFWTAARRLTRLPPEAVEERQRLAERVHAGDALFRERLGIGVLQFAALYSPTGNVEDIGRAPR